MYQRFLFEKKWKEIKKKRICVVEFTWKEQRINEKKFETKSHPLKLKTKWKEKKKEMKWKG